MEGTSGNSYGIVTIVRPGRRFRRTVSLDDIQKAVKELYNFARERPDLEFLVAYTNDNNNLNGYTSSEMASVFAGDIPDNVVFEEDFYKLICEVDP